LNKRGAALSFGWWAHWNDQLQKQLVCVLLRMREFWCGQLASICIVSHGKGQVTYTRNIWLKQLQNGWTMLQILCRISRQKVRNFKPLAKITLPYDKCTRWENLCVSPFDYVLWNIGIPVGPLPPRKVASPNRADYCSIAILHLFQKKLETWKAPPKNSRGTTLGKGNGIKWGANGNTLEEALRTSGTSLGTWSEHTQWKNSILTPLTPRPLSKRKKDEPSWVYVQSTHRLHAYSIPRHGCHHFCASGNTPSTKHPSKKHIIPIQGVLILFHIN